MKRYEYERVFYEGIVAEKLEYHREVIDRRAAEGWRYVDHISVHESRGCIVAVDLIFEKESEE